MKKELEVYAANIRRIKFQMAKDRDSLRDIYDEIHDLIEHYDTSIESLDIVDEELNSSVEILSEIV